MSMPFEERHTLFNNNGILKIYFVVAATLHPDVIPTVLVETVVNVYAHSFYV